MTFFLNESIATSSRRTYKAGMSRYTEFCRQRKWSPFPASESSLVESVASTAFEVQYQTLKVYLAGIKHHHQLAGLPDPIATSIRLPLVLRGIRQRGLQLPSKLLRLPITIKIMGELKCALREQLDLSTDDLRMYWAAFTTAFFGFLRCLEYTAPSPSHLTRTERFYTPILQSTPTGIGCTSRSLRRTRSAWA